jgi:hypothetical protein
MPWGKLGRVFDPACLEECGLTAALTPVAHVLDSAAGLVRVFYSPRDRSNRSQVRCFDFNLSDLSSTRHASTSALLTHGKTGAFDDAGVTLGSLVTANGRHYLFYTGWNLTVSVPFNNSIGIAEYRDGAFVRRGDGPVMTRTLHEPYSCASPFVIHEKQRFRMWYASMDRWQEEPAGGVRHYYNIKYCESVDGTNWSRQGVVAIDYQDPGEYAFGRPFVIGEDGGYKMWYSVRGDAYRIGYAVSADGMRWERQDERAGIDVSDSGWDSEMIEYPWVFDAAGRRYMLYNGNGFGRTGIGLAVWVEGASQRE